MSLEEDLILSLSRTRLNKVQVPDHIDWDNFLEKVYAEGLSGLIFYNLDKYELKSIVPEWVYHRLSDDYNINLGRNIYITTELEKICASFKDKQLSVLLLRGGSFLNHIYPSLGIRVMTDIDLVIHSEDLIRVKSALKELGYNCEEDYPYFFLKDSLAIDLHLDVAGLWRFDAGKIAISIKNAKVWEEAESISVAYENIRRLSNYDSILACCHHLQVHSYQRLIWFIDVVRLIENKDNNFDWEFLIARARKFNLQKCTYFVIKYLQSTGLLEVPVKQLSNLAKASLNYFERKSLEKLLNNQREDILGEALNLFSIPQLSGRFKFLLETTLPSRDKCPVIYSRSMFLNYIYRFSKLAFDCAKKVPAYFLS